MSLVKDGREDVGRFDDMDDVRRDGLPFALAQIDPEGVVASCNATFARLFDASDAVGRNFFRDIAPATNLPAFRGRFIEALRRGPVDERFRFVFGVDPAPVRAEVRIAPSRTAGLYWLVVLPTETVSPGAHRQAAQQQRAAEAVGHRVRAEPVDPSVCELEPIHIPGAIQPHATLIAADPNSPELPVEACSENAADLFPVAGPAALLGRPLAELLPPTFCRQLLGALASGRLDDPARPYRTGLRLADTEADGRETSFAVAAHRHDGRLVLELERVADRPEDFGGADAIDAQYAVARLRAAEDLAAAAAVTAREIRAMTGFDRVVVYRFDAEWNGEAIAEDKADGWTQSLLGLRFPASDIPAQARALYARSPSRFVVDRDAVTSALVAAPQAANRAVDLSFAAARALSPIHLEYQRNLGVNGSMSASIIVDDRLWGLVIGHHPKPHYVTPETRALAVVATDAFALRVHELENVRLWRAQRHTLATQNRLLGQMARSDDFVAAITSADGGATLLDLIGAGGAAVVSGDRIAIVGAAPSREAVAGLADWLRGHVPRGEPVFSTDQISAHCAEAAAMRDSASGVLAAFVGDGPEGREHLLIWFRPEVASTIVWGGDPNKPVMADPAERTLLPRRSFERWVEERRGRSDPWEPWQEGAAAALALAIEGVILRQGRRIADLMAQQSALSLALEQKEVLAREVDHRVKNSLQMVGGLVLMQSRRVSDPAATAVLEDMYARVMSVARVHESLHQSDDVQNADLGLTVRKLCDDLAAGVTGGRRSLAVAAEPDLMVSSRTAVALSLIVSELVTNALKYAYGPEESGAVDVTVRTAPSGQIEVRVADQGKGLPGGASGWAPGGLGMRVINAMVSQIGAKMTVADGAPGAVFTVTA